LVGGFPRLQGPKSLLPTENARAFYSPLHPFITQLLEGGHTTRCIHTLMDCGKHGHLGFQDWAAGWFSGLMRSASEGSAERAQHDCCVTINDSRLGLFLAHYIEHTKRNCIGYSANDAEACAFF
jgi:hypothetical protein